MHDPNAVRDTVPNRVGPSCINCFRIHVDSRHLEAPPCEHDGLCTLPGRAVQRARHRLGSRLRSLYDDMALERSLHDSGVVNDFAVNDGQD